VARMLVLKPQDAWQCMIQLELAVCEARSLT
jgi:hypothetical protein